MDSGTLRNITLMAERTPTAIVHRIELMIEEMHKAEHKKKMADVLWEIGQTNWIAPRWLVPCHIHTNGYRIIMWYDRAIDQYFNTVGVSQVPQVYFNARTRLLEGYWQ